MLKLELETHHINRSPKIIVVALVHELFLPSPPRILVPMFTPVTDNYPTWNSGRERVAVEIISHQEFSGLVRKERPIQCPEARSYFQQSGIFQK